jgi:hypothetical protein
MFKVSLSTNPQYDALSYTWGDANDTKSISVNGQKFKVTTNLFAALNRMQHDEATRILWVDSICIDQGNVVERNNQVKMMAQVYTEARTVRMWVGEETSDTPLAFQALRRWTILLSAWEDGTYLSEMEKAACEMDIVSSYVKEISEDHKVSAAILALTQRPYWSRMWITQEVLLANLSAMLHCGSHTFLWRYVQKLVRGLWLYSNKLDLEPMDRFKVSDLTKAIGNLRHIAFSGIRPIRGTFRLTADLLATDPRDKIYGLLGIADFTECPDLLISPDYSKGAGEIYTDFIVRVYESRGLESIDKMGFFMSAGIGHPPEVPSLNLPSWVPDIRSSSEWSSRLERQLSKYRASLDLPSRIELTEQSLGKRSVLQVQAMIMDVVFLASPLHSSIGSRKGFGTAFSQTIRMDANQSQRHPSGLTFLNVFFRTWLMQTPGKEYGLRGIPDNEHGREMYEMALGFYYGSLELAAKDAKAEKCLDAFLDSFDWEGSRWTPETFRSIEERFRVILGPILSRYMLATTGLDRAGGPSFFFTSGNYIGLGPNCAEKGDVLCIVLGCPVPILIRPDVDDYRLVGPCYVYGLMDGEAVRDLKSEDRSSKVDTIRLV